MNNKTPLDSLIIMSRLPEELVIKSIMSHYGDTCIRNYGDLTANKIIRRNEIDPDADDDSTNE